MRRSEADGDAAAVALVAPVVAEDRGVGFEAELDPARSVGEAAGNLAPILVGRGERERRDRLRPGEAREERARTVEEVVHVISRQMRPEGVAMAGEAQPGAGIEA